MVVKGILYIYIHIDFNIYIYGKAVAYRGRGQHAGAACASASGLRKAEAATVAQEELVEEEFEVLHPNTCRILFAQGVPKTEKCATLPRKHTTKKGEASISPGKNKKHMRKRTFRKSSRRCRSLEPRPNMADEFDQWVVPRAKAKALAAVKFANEAHEKFLAKWDLDPPHF